MDGLRLAAALTLLAGCSRTAMQMDPPDGVDAGGPWDRAYDSGLDAPVACPDPEAETCNGRDDDCDGIADEDVTPQPCPTGGVRYCLSGHWSLCPCACVPGSERWCFGTYCSGWGVNTCTSDGAWSPDCVEESAPSGCGGDLEATSEDEECCLEIGGCCLDTFDLDGDGDTGESIGACAGVACN